MIEAVRKMLLRILRFPNSDQLKVFEPIADARASYWSVLDKMKERLERNTFVLQAYLFRANINEVSNALTLGISFASSPDYGLIRDIGGIWGNEKPIEPLAILPLSADMITKLNIVAQPFFQA